MYYNKPQEIDVVLRIIEKYMVRRGNDFEEAQEKFFEHTKYYSNLTIKSDNDYSYAIRDLNNLREAKEEYEKAKSIYKEVKKISNMYNEGFLLGTSQSTVDTHFKKANKSYHELKMQHDFIEFMNKLAVEEWTLAMEYSPDKTLFKGLEYGLEDKLDELGRKVDNNEIHRDTYIFYDLLCPYLYDTPEFKQYMEYMQQLRPTTNTNSQRTM